MKRILLTLSIVIAALATQAQNLDSLWEVWNDKAQADTNRLKAMSDIAWDGYLFSQPDSAFYFALMQYDLAEKSGLKKQMADALNIQGASFYLRGDYPKALDYYQRGLKVQEQMGDKKGIAKSLVNIGNIYISQSDNLKALDHYQRSLNITEEIRQQGGEVGDKSGIASSLNNMGIIYEDQGDFPKALDHYQRSLTIREEMGDKRGIASSLNNIGSIYNIQSDSRKAIDYYQRSLKMMEEMGDKRGVASSLNNIGVIYSNQSDDTKALDYFEKSLTIREEIGHKNEIASSLNNIGNIYDIQGDYTKALDYYQRSLKIGKEMGDKNGIARSLISIGSFYQKKGDYQLAINQCNEGLLLAQEIGVIDLERDACQCLYDAYKAAGNSNQALANHEQYIVLKDSLFNEENTKKLTQLEMQYDFDKKEAAAQLEQEKKDALAAADLKRNKLIRNGFIAAFTVMLLFALVFFNQRNKIKKDNLLISEQKKQTEIQKEIIEESHKEITDSIAYAKRIQNAILPPNKLVQQYLDNSFILYKPKDVVAGDFYWMEPKGDTLLFAAADCTGHGVPGAMVSVVCVNGLNRSVREFGLTEPGKILDNTRQLVIKEFEKSEEDVQDGMDIALCSLGPVLSPTDSPNGEFYRELKYAGANNPLWIVRKGKILETKADKQPIGKYALEAPFNTHSIELQKGDSIYIFSDGYVDQFGGEQGKKFKAKALRELLLSVQDNSMEEQRVIIDRTFEDWRGDNEQIDDVCFIGVRI